MEDKWVINQCGRKDQPFRDDLPSLDKGWGWDGFLDNFHLSWHMYHFLHFVLVETYMFRKYRSHLALSGWGARWCMSTGSFPKYPHHPGAGTDQSQVSRMSDKNPITWSHHQLPPVVCNTKKLEPGTKLHIQSRYSRVGCGHLNR